MCIIYLIGVIINIAIVCVEVKDFLKTATSITLVDIIMGIFMPLFIFTSFLGSLYYVAVKSIIGGEDIIVFKIKNK